MEKSVFHKAKDVIENEFDEEGMKDVIRGRLGYDPLKDGNLKMLMSHDILVHPYFAESKMKAIELLKEKFDDPINPLSYIISMKVGELLYQMRKDDMMTTVIVDTTHVKDTYELGKLLRIYDRNWIVKDLQELKK